MHYAGQLRPGQVLARVRVQHRLRGGLEAQGMDVAPEGGRPAERGSQRGGDAGRGGEPKRRCARRGRATLEPATESGQSLLKRFLATLYSREHVQSKQGVRVVLGASFSPWWVYISNKSGGSTSFNATPRAAGRSQHTQHQRTADPRSPA